MALDLNKIIHQLEDGNFSKKPPLHLWQPEHTGVIDIRIDAQGNWFHEGSEFKRLSLVKLLSSILCVEDQRYFLKTPAEKLEIVVEDVPFIINAFIADSDKGGISFVSNTEDVITLTEQSQWQVREFQGTKVPYIHIGDNLYARLGRNVFYQLVEIAEISLDSQGQERAMITSYGLQFLLE